MEIEILNLINQNLHGSSFINYFFKILSILSDKGIIWIVLGLALMFFKKTRKAGFITLIGVLSTLLINTLILKNIFDRARPFVENPDLISFIKGMGMELPDDNSFPSGHTFVAFCCSIILCLNLKKKWWFVYIFAGLTAFSRIFLCVHYPTDVLAGIIAGTAVGVGIHFLFKFIFKKLSPNTIKQNWLKRIVLFINPNPQCDSLANKQAKNNQQQTADTELEE